MHPGAKPVGKRCRRPRWRRAQLNRIKYQSACARSRQNVAQTREIGEFTLAGLSASRQKGRDTPPSRRRSPHRRSTMRRGAAASISPSGARPSGCSTNPTNSSDGRVWRWFAAASSSCCLRGASGRGG